MGFIKSIRRALTPSGFDLFSSKKYDEDAEHMVAELHPDAQDGGGLACNDKKLLLEMRECIMQWIKSMGRQLLQGNLNLVNTSFPVLMFEPRSYLQKMADVWAYPDLVNAAAAQQDPLERMKLLVAWLVAGLHHGLETWKKPFNPILGETWQAHMPGDVTLFMEQISHHPPVSAYQLQGPGWRLSGWSQPAVVPVVRFYGIKTVAKGARRVDFDDGSVVEISTPYFAIKGVVYAAKPHAEVLGVARLLDHHNRLEAIINFGPVPGTRQRMLARADAVCGEIYQLPRAPHLQEAAAAHGALRRSATAATPLPEMSADDLTAPSVVSSDSRSDVGYEPSTAAATAGHDDDDDDEAVDEEAIFDEFTATHFGNDNSSSSSTAATSAANGSAAQLQATAQQQQQQQPGCSGANDREQQQLHVASHRSNHAATDPQPYRRAKTSVMDRGGGRSVSSGGGGGGLTRSGSDAAVPGVAVARIEGCWLSHLNIDNKRYWTLTKAQPQRWSTVGDPLPSDLQFRQDLASLAGNDLSAAQHWKEVLEHQQRADRKLREAAGVYEHH